jgi:hypothetical protein
MAVVPDARAHTRPAICTRKSKAAFDWVEDGLVKERFYRNVDLCPCPGTVHASVSLSMDRSAPARTA